MKIMLELPAVDECSVADCSYNTGNSCHARAITIGNGATPQCDTLYCGSRHIHDTNTQAGVGACTVSKCSFNDDLECTADSITVGLIDGNVDCLTYLAR
jgi:hypothetical protein